MYLSRIENVSFQDYPNSNMFDMSKSLAEQTEPVLRALLSLHKTEEGRQKIIDILEAKKET